MDFWKYYSGNETDLLPNITKHSHEKEIAKYNPKWANEYVSEHGIDEELEPAIAKDAYYSYHYALDILEGPFNLGEPAIAKDIEYSYLYADEVLGGPFNLGEPAIAKNAEYSYSYAKEILKNKPFKLGEQAIAKDAYFSYQYTNKVLKKDFYLDGKLICKYEG